MKSDNKTLCCVFGCLHRKLMKRSASHLLQSNVAVFLFRGRGWAGIAAQTATEERARANRQRSVSGVRRGDPASPGGDGQELPQVRRHFIFATYLKCFYKLNDVSLCFSYEFVKYLRQYVESSLGAVIEKETESCSRGDGHGAGSGQDTLVHAVTNGTRESAQYVALYSLVFISCRTL